MTDQIDSLKAVLQNKRSELARAIRSQSAQLSVCESENDVLDRMQSMSARDEAVTFLDTFTSTLAKVDAALMAIELGVYGICVECDEPISSRRLQAIPWALHCIRCQETLDRRNGMRAARPHWDAAA
jgi:DnaK suppressor protein